MPGYGATVSKIQDLVGRYGNRYANRYARGESSSDAELMQFIEAEKTKRERKKSLLQPLETIFDLLQRGQYVTANIGQELKDASQTGERPEIWNAIKEGLTGQTKGDWTDVIFGEEEEWGDISKMGKVGRKFVGFLANVLLDPLTYVGGPTNVAKKAGKQYADDVARVFIRELGENADDLYKFARGFDVGQLRKLADESAEGALSYLVKNGGGDVARQINQKMRQAYRRGIRTPGHVLQREMQERVVRARPGVQGAGFTMMDPGAGGKITQDILSDTGRYAGAGERAFAKVPFLGRRGELLKGVREAPPWVKAWDKAGGMIQNSDLFSRAVWSLTGPQTAIGKIKGALGIRNPYQQLLNTTRRSGSRTFESYITDYSRQINNALDPLDNTTVKAVRDLLIEFQGKDITPEVLAELGSKAPGAVEAVSKIQQLTGGWMKQLTEAVDDHIIREVGEIQNYLPIRRKSKYFRRAGTDLGTPQSSFMKRREVGFEGGIGMETKRLGTVLGIEDDLAEQMVKAGGGDMVMDLKQMLTERGVAQAKFNVRADLVRQFREFGIPAKEIEGALTAQGRNIPELGLKEIQDYALEGYLFDTDVAEILERSVSLTSADKPIEAFTRLMGRWTSLLKGWMTLSPGFHIRNMNSNNIMGILNYGGEWLDPKLHYDSVITSLVGLYGKEVAQKRAKLLGVSAGRFNRMLAKEYGGESLESLAEFAAHRGVVSRAVRGFDIEETVDTLAGTKKLATETLNPMSRHNIALKKSHDLGNIVESESRMASFLLEVKRAGGGERGKLNGVIEAKKIFFDYEDVTDFEKKYLRKLIPFYTWMRKNVARQMDNMMHMTSTYSVIPKAEQAISDTDIDPRDLPEWMRNAGYLPISNNTAFWPNAPYADVNLMPIKFRIGESGIPIPQFDAKDAVRDILISAHPVVKSLVEVPTGYDIFYQAPMGEVREAPGLTKVLGKAPKVLQFLDGLARGVGLEPAEFQLRENKLYIDSSIAKLLENNLPMLKQIERFLDAPEVLFPAVEKVLEEDFGMYDRYEGIEKLYQTLSFNLGIKFKGLSLDEVRSKEAEDILRAAEEARRKQRRSQPGNQVYRDRYWLQREARRRRLVGS